jgi:hypothetical protein
LSAGVLVDDARDAYDQCVANGAKGVRTPVTLTHDNGESAVVSEVELYGDVVLRFISGDYQVRYHVLCARRPCSGRAGETKVLTHSRSWKKPSNIV